ncbi:MAG: ABC transporter ATP-binding protein [Vicinamibacterales bacterium]
MSETVIRAHDLRKVYRLYSGAGSRFLDMFGLLSPRAGAFTEHAALDGVSLEITRGEKVAFIGRNGAGKSTLLKLVTKVIEPTSGTLEVSGKIHALLQIGTGFHPDFTGRQNIYAYLAQLGVTGKAAEAKCTEIVEFAELEEYIDQPVKTYSTGMSVRLMFSTATAITPELLVLDEVLGVGDAYFAQKSYDRIRTLCAGAGTTLLLVTHDVYTAAKVCDRMIWIDRGRVLIDGDPSQVIAAYEDSVRQQEERRLRARRMVRTLPDAATTALLVEARAPGGRPLPAPVYFSRLTLLIDGTAVDSLPIGAPQSATSHLVEETGAWGAPTIFHGEPARPWNNFGSVFHKVSGAFDVSGLLTQEHPDGLALELVCWSEEACAFEMHGFLGTREVQFDSVTLPEKGWTTVRVEPVEGIRPPPPAKDEVLRFGSGRVVIGEIRTLDQDRRAKALFAHNDPFTLAVGYHVNDPEFDEEVQVLVSFHRDGAHDVCRVICPSLRLTRSARRGTVEMTFPELRLGSGSYTVSVGITEPGYFDRQQTVFYSINPGMYDCVNRGLEIEVVDAGVVGTGTGWVADAEWIVVPESGTLTTTS